MSSVQLLNLAVWAACLSAGATIVTLVTGILFFTRGQPFGSVNDAASVFQVLFTLPLAWALYVLLGRDAPVLSLTATVIGTSGMLFTAVLQALLVFRRVTFEQTFHAVLAGGAAMGIWLVVVGYLALTGSELPGGLAWAGVVAGSGYLLSAVGFFASGKQGLLFFLGAGAGLVAYSIWAIWLARTLCVGARMGLG